MTAAFEPERAVKFLLTCRVLLNDLSPLESVFPLNQNVDPLSHLP
jgi:hypothetical protein